MKRKIIAVTVISLSFLLLAPDCVEASVFHYWWDNVYFKEGTDIKYPHPDESYYDISKYLDWTGIGTKLHHFQINEQTTQDIITLIVGIGTVAGLILALKMGGGATASLVGGLAGLVITSFLTRVIDFYFVDERGCIWFWLSNEFISYLMYSMDYLASVLEEYALALITSAFLFYGYLGVGKVVMHDPLGIGKPQAPQYPLRIGSMNGGHLEYFIIYDTYWFDAGTVVTLKAIPDQGWHLLFWLIDDVIIEPPAPYINSIQVTMDQEHYAKPVFSDSTGGGGGSGDYYLEDYDE